MYQVDGSLPKLQAWIYAQSYDRDFGEQADFLNQKMSVFNTRNPQAMMTKSYGNT
jgi:hypothetical protein